MGRHAKTLLLIEAAREILQENHPMTIRQIYYQLVSRQVIENSLAAYKRVSKALVSALQEGLIPWEWIEDRLRRPRAVSMWSDLKDFARDAASAYRRDVWETQPICLEVWLEKDALSGVFEDVLSPYGITLNVGRGYDGWSSIHEAAQRYLAGDKDVTILYFGDFDPSGEDMARSLQERLAFFGCSPTVVKCALTAEDVKRYNLPPNPTKKTDTRHKAFVERFGDLSVELDALPLEVLIDRIRQEVERRLDLDALESVKEQEERERELLIKQLAEI